MVNWSILYRPSKLSEVYGADNLKAYTANCIKTKQWPEALLLKGRYGTGKTTVAKILATMMVCQNPSKNGDPCCECPSCKAIIEETFNRDVINIDGAKDKSEDILELLTAFSSTRPFNDKTKVAIIDEMQSLSMPCKAKLLKLLESRNGNVHYIFTSMQEGPTKVQDSSMKALESRLQTFDFKSFSSVDVMKYMYYDIIKAKEIKIPEENKVEFIQKGLDLISQTCEGSIRKAILLLQQCIETESFSFEKVKEICGASPIDDFYVTLLNIMNGEVNDDVYNTLINVTDYDGMVRLAMNTFANAEMYRLFGKMNLSKATSDSVNEAIRKGIYEDILKTNKPSKVNEFYYNSETNRVKQLISNPNYSKVRDAFFECYRNNNSYISKSSYIMSMAKIIDMCKKESMPEGLTPIRRHAVAS